MTSVSGLNGSSERAQALATCARLPSAELTNPFGPDTAIFKINGKMFAAVSLDDLPGRLTLKCDPDDATYLVDQFDGFTRGYHMNKRHWITITLGSTLPSGLVEDLITDSYHLVCASRPARARSSPKTGQPMMSSGRGPSCSTFRK